MLHFILMSRPHLGVKLFAFTHLYYFNTTADYSSKISHKKYFLKAPINNQPYSCSFDFGVFDQNCYIISFISP